jgi:intein/homing endonuclease
MIEQKDKKFLDVIDLNDWEIETDTGWKDIKRIGKTIPYEKWIIKTKNYFLECADEHIVFLDDMSEIYSKDLKKGDLIMTQSGPDEVISVTNTGELICMYDMEVDSEEHRYYTNGILSHNTLWLGNIAAQAIRASNHVAIITLELNDRKYMKRLGSNLLGIRMSEYKDCAENDELIKKKIKNLGFDNLRTPGELVVREFPTSQASAIDVENWLLKVEQILGIKFKIIIIDYINIMKNWRNPNSENTYMKIKQIAEDLRAAAMRNEWAIVTATQTKQCLTLDTKIESKERGLINIGDCKVDEEILCEQGWTKILHKTIPEKQKVFMITTKSGKKIKCSGKHRFPLSNGEEKSCSDLKHGDILLSKNI